MLRKLIKIAVFSWLAGCATPAPAPKEPCYCGWVSPNAEAPKVCAVWQKHWTSSERQPVLKTAPSATCTLKACATLFKETPCEPLEMWVEPTVPAPVSAAPTEPGCFCDLVAVRNHPGGELACAMWKGGDTYLREYHFTTECEPATCGSKPFLDSQAICQGQFRKFFTNPEP